jgi:hypothetical protein
MLAGAALNVAWVVSISMHHESAGLYSVSGWLGEAYWTFLGVMGCAPWLWMAWMTLSGQGWARVVSVLLFDIFFVAFVPALVRDSASSATTAGVAVELLVGIAAIILQWRPAASWFFEAARQARNPPMGGFVAS